LYKFAQITFSRQKSSIKYHYSISESDIPVVTQIKDLGIILSNDLSFNSHINAMCNKALVPSVLYIEIARNLKI
jgi:hypothetical protein